MAYKYMNKINALEHNRPSFRLNSGVDPCTLNEWAGTVKLLIENNINPW